HASVDAFLLELRLCLQRVSHFEATRDDGDVRAFAVHLRLTDLEIVTLVVNDGGLRASSTHEYRTNVLGHAVHQRTRAEFVGRAEDYEARETARERQVFHRLLARSVFTDRDPTVRADKLRIHLRISHGDAQLVVAF